MKLGDRGEGSIHPNGKGWIACRYFGGKRHRKTFSTQEKAKAQLKKWRREIDGERFVGPVKERVTVDELLDYRLEQLKTDGAKSIPSAECHMEHIRAAFGHTRAVNLTPTHIRRYTSDRQKAGAANATIDNELIELRAAYNLALEDELLTRMPKVPMVGNHKIRTGFFTVAEFMGVVGHLEKPVNDVAMFAYLVPWRKSEVLCLGWANIDREAREIRLDETKGDTEDERGRVVEYEAGGEVDQLIERRWAARQYERPDGTTAVSEYVFHRGGRPVVDIRKRWIAACTAAKLPGGRLFHDLRRTGVRDLIRAGVNQAAAMSISGHKTDSVFRRYNIIDAKDRREGLERVQAYRARQPTKRNVEDMAG